MNHGHRDHLLSGSSYVGFNCLPGSNRHANGGKGFVAPRPWSNLYRGGALEAVGALDLGTIQENKLAV